MSIARKILIDEMIEQSHICDVDDVIVWALENYVSDPNKKVMNGALVANAILERIKSSEINNEAELQNPELVNSLNLL